MRARPIDDAEIPRFLELARTIYADDPHWVPPFGAQVTAQVCNRSPFARYARVQPFLCEDTAGRAVGRIAAIWNPRLTDGGGQVVGQVGFFESIDSGEAAGGLFQAALGWLGELGAREVWGPMNGGAHLSHRLMIEGFGQSPFLFEPRNPPYYPALFEMHGFTRVGTWTSHDFAREDSRRIIEKLRPVARAGEREFALEFLDPSRPEDTLPRLHRLLDRAWTGHPGYAPFESEEMLPLFGGLLAVMGPRNLAVAVERATGEDVGLSFTVPDWTDEARALDGDASRWASWMVEGRTPERLIWHTVAVAPGARRAGAAGVLVHGLTQAGWDAGYPRLVLALNVSTFTTLARQLPVTRRYALYRRAI
jgi:hypothetical protein